MGTIKDKNGMDLTEAENIKKRWQEYTEELYKKDLHDPDNHDSLITHLEPDILECEVNWALGSPLVTILMIKLITTLTGETMNYIDTIFLEQCATKVIFDKLRVAMCEIVSHFRMSDSR